MGFASKLQDLSKQDTNEDTMRVATVYICLYLS